MIFEKLNQISGAYLIKPEKIEDERGFFARAWCQNEFRRIGLETRIVQANLSFNKKKGTLRGLHFQKRPFEEVKLVRCFRGAIYDVIVDIRNDSPTYKNWIGVELSAENRFVLYVPRGCAHGFITMENDTEVFYMVSEFYTPRAEGGIRYDDPAFKIKWPVAITEISKKDLSWDKFVE